MATTIKLPKLDKAVFALVVVVVVAGVHHGFDRGSKLSFADVGWSTARGGMKGGWCWDWFGSSGGFVAHCQPVMVVKSQLFIVYNLYAQHTK